MSHETSWIRADFALILVCFMLLLSLVWSPCIHQPIRNVSRDSYLSLARNVADFLGNFLVPVVALSRCDLYLDSHAKRASNLLVLGMFPSGCLERRGKKKKGKGER